MAEQEPDKGRRCMLVAASTVAGGVAAAAAGVPFVASMLPSERAKAAGAPVEADISQLAPGERMTVEWRGKPVWIVRRTPEMLDSVKKNADKVSDPASKKVMQPKYATNEMRSIKPEYLVLVGICTHLGCSPVENSARKPRHSPPTGKAVFTARATARCLISRAASTKTCLPPTT